MIKTSIFIAVLCGPERHAWIHPVLSAALVQWTMDERFDMEYVPIGFSPSEPAGYASSQEARNAAIEMFLTTQHKWLLMLDNDVIPAQDGRIINLLDLAGFRVPPWQESSGLMDCDIVSAPVPVHAPDAGGVLRVFPNVYERAPADEVGRYRPVFDLSKAGPDGLIEVDAVGTGAIMIARSVIEELSRQKVSQVHDEPKTDCAVFLRPRDQYGRTKIGEDLLFCERARAAGFHVWVSTNHLCGHAHTMNLNSVAKMIAGPMADSLKRTPTPDLADVAASKTGCGPSISDGGWPGGYDYSRATAEDYGLPAGTELPKITNFSSPPGTCRILREAYRQIQPDVVLEFGSGISTLVLADEIRRNLEGLAGHYPGRPALRPFLYSFENDSETAEAIARLPGIPIGSVFESPIVAEGCRWYQVNDSMPCRRRHNCRILAFVDGPSTRDSGPRGRGHALTFIDERFPGWTGAILLDDANRTGEAADLAEWAQVPSEYISHVFLAIPEVALEKRIGVLARGIAPLKFLDPPWPLTTKATGNVRMVDPGKVWVPADYGLTGPCPPITGWSITPGIGRFLREVVGTLGPGPRILELGSGISTFVLADAMPDEGRLITVEHDMEFYLDGSDFSRRTKRLRDTVTSVHWPLSTGRWYESASIPGMIELLFIDGPPGHVASLARYPALPRLHQYLAPGALIVLDDYQREDEKEIVRRWLRDYRARLDDVALTLADVPGVSTGPWTAGWLEAGRTTCILSFENGRQVAVMRWRG